MLNIIYYIIFLIVIFVSCSWFTFFKIILEFIKKMYKFIFSKNFIKEFFIKMFFVLYNFIYKIYLFFIGWFNHIKNSISDNYSELLDLLSFFIDKFKFYFSRFVGFVSYLKMSFDLLLKEIEFLELDFFGVLNLITSSVMDYFLYFVSYYICFLKFYLVSKYIVMTLLFCILINCIFLSLSYVIVSHNLFLFYMWLFCLFMSFMSLCSESYSDFDMFTGKNYSSFLIFVFLFLLFDTILYSGFNFCCFYYMFFPSNMNNIAFKSFFFFSYLINNVMWSVLILTVLGVFLMLAGWKYLLFKNKGIYSIKKVSVKSIDKFLRSAAKYTSFFYEVPSMITLVIFVIFMWVLMILDMSYTYSGIMEFMYKYNAELFYWLILMASKNMFAYLLSDSEMTSSQSDLIMYKFHLGLFAWYMSAINDFMMFKCTFMILTYLICRNINAKWSVSLTVVMFCVLMLFVLPKFLVSWMLWYMVIYVIMNCK